MKLEDIKITTKKIEILNSMKIDSVEDLLMHYPFRYEEHNEVDFNEWNANDKVCFEALIISQARVTRFAYKRSATKFKVQYNGIELDVTLFNRPWTNAFQVGKKISIFAKYEGNYKVTCMNYNAQPLSEQLGYQPIYNLKEGISQKEIRKYIAKALEVCDTLDFVPSEYRNKYRLINRLSALNQIHNPINKEGLRQSIRALKYEEFLRFQIQMQYMKSLNTEVVGFSKTFDRNQIETFIASFPFQLTTGQSTAIDEILNDLQALKIMYRLVQGDVGCGKTQVAAVAMYATLLSKHQAAMLAPTEILAKQHYKNLLKTFDGFDVNIALLYSSMNKKEKDIVLNELNRGTIDIIVGTHALFQDDVCYHNLGIVVADEQHRFGVEQRRKLLGKGDKVDFLLMSATPIPRTLAVSLFTDMDVSTIETLPEGRKSIISEYIKEDTLKSILSDVLKMIDEGNQCYIVAPAIEKNDEYVMRNVFELYQNMNDVLGRKYKIALLHGKMSSEEKDEVMNAFQSKQYDILITTTVIEVGVDVKDANIMIIYDAHRFGMSQIHQLRGRVGRGSRQGYCFLLSGTKDKETQKRLQICADLSDGFEISKADLEIRGPGDLLGIRQSGISGFILGDVINDKAILEVAKEDALNILKRIDLYPKINTFILKKDYTSYLD